MWNSARPGARGNAWGAVALVVCGLTAAPTVCGQSRWDSETGEVAGFGGTTMGLGKTQPAVGASTGLAFSKYGLGLFEVVFSPLSTDTMRRRPIGAPRVQDSLLFDINGGMHIQIPVRRKWAPYGIVGGGMLLNSFRAVNTAPGEIDPSTGEPVREGGLTAAVREVNFAFHTGGGVRYYVKEDWGIRPEFKIIISNQTYTRFTVGIFYNLPSSWPW